jgi:hypothetical protein
MSFKEGLQHTIDWYMAHREQLDADVNLVAL